VDVEHSSTNQPIVYVDGGCVLCNNLALFLIKIDKHKTLKFGLIVELKNLPASIENVDSIILHVNQKFLVKSEAVFEIIRIVGGWLKVFLMFSILPLSFLNKLYDLVAKYRSRLFGITQTCRIPKNRLLK
jgi:predicted DCC family thiol-disulfide oxidoreductase YuxK